MIGQDLIKRFDERFGRLERSQVKYRQGVVTDDSPLTVELGASGVAVPAVAAGSAPAVGETAHCLTWNNDLIVLAGPAGYSHIGDFTNSGTVLSYSSIPQTFKHLQVRLVGQSEAPAVANSSWRMTYNGVTTAFYNYGYWTWGALGGASTRSATSFWLGTAPAATRTSGDMVSIFTIDIPFYAATNNNHQMQCRFSGDDGVTTLFGTILGSFVQTSVAVTSIELRETATSTLGARARAELWAA